MPRAHAQSALSPAVLQGIGEGLSPCRGYSRSEWYLLKEAKARNPDILTYGLSWAWPAWTGNFTDSPWNAPAKAANYTLNWLRCARDSHSLDIDYVGCWNERSYSADYLKLLRRELDSSGFPSTRIVAPDSNWDIAGEMLTDPELMDAVDIVGAHYPGMTSSSDAIKTGKLLAASEDDSTFGDNIGTGCWARLLNRNWVQGRMSATMCVPCQRCWRWRFAPLPPGCRGRVGKTKRSPSRAPTVASPSERRPIASLPPHHSACPPFCSMWNLLASY